MFLFPDREPKFPDGALFMPIESDRISLVKRKDNGFMNRCFIYTGYPIQHKWLF